MWTRWMSRAGGSCLPIPSTRTGRPSSGASHDQHLRRSPLRPASSGQRPAGPGMCGLPAAVSAGWGTIPMEDAVNASTAGRDGRIVVAGAGYAGLHVALRLTARLRHNPMLELTLVDRHDYHQAITELPPVAGGTRAADAGRIPLQDLLATRVRFGP